MNSAFSPLGFLPADILLPRDCDLSRWSVVACDQYTSQPDYWQRVEQRVGDAPSALRLILPESMLEDGRTQEHIRDINATMDSYLEQGRFELLPDALIYVERTLDNGRVRRGLVGRVDLEQYDYTPGSAALIRATEGTVLSRIPPRVAVRRGASLELPHVMLLVDDGERTVIEPLSAQTGAMRPLYDFDLMERGGHVAGWQLTDGQADQVAGALARLARPDVFETKYDAAGKPVLLFAVGDGNHSLATAKASYEEQKQHTPPEQWAGLPGRYALVELVNLHDEALEFEPIHRVVFGVEPEQLLADLLAAYPGAHPGEGEGHVLRYVHEKGRGAVTVPNPAAQLAVGTLQTFLDGWLADRPGARIDYVHGDDVTQGLAAQPGNIGFLLPPMGKDQLFRTVVHDGVLPRKTFSMGEAHDKRFYLEARRIK